MTDTELEVLLAEKVMGWHKGIPKEPHFSLPADGWWIDAQGETVMAIGGWRPLQVAAQALRVLETFCKATGYACATDYDAGMWLVRFYSANEVWDALTGDFCRAVCEAVGKAVTP